MPAAVKTKETATTLPKMLFRRKEAAYTLGLSVRSIDAMIADKRLTTRRFGSSVLIPAADVQRVADTILRSDMLQGTAQGCTNRY